jgi:hypothetical protein
MDKQENLISNLEECIKIGQSVKEHLLELVTDNGAQDENKDGLSTKLDQAMYKTEYLQQILNDIDMLSVRVLRYFGIE